MLALTRYGGLAASSRQRFLLYTPALAEAGIELEVSALLSDDHMRRLVAGRSKSLLHTAAAYARRLTKLLQARHYDLIWLYGEGFPYLPALIERLIFLPRKPVVIDIDDAFFHVYTESPSAVVRRLLGGKFDGLFRDAAACTCGNPYLEAYAARHNDRTLQVPTVVDTDKWVPNPSAHNTDNPPVIGWIGSPSTWANVRPLLPMLRRLHERHGVIIRAIGTGQAAREDRFDGLELVEWSEATEIAEVQRFTIGIMPLLDLPFQRGKSGFKLIQYMACGLPVVASPVGVNSDIVRDGENGWLASSAAEWEQRLTELLGEPSLRQLMGEKGRARAVADYSLASQAPRLVQLFREVTARS